jgi:hypothetical protein
MLGVPQKQREGGLQRAKPINSQRSLFCHDGSQMGPVEYMGPTWDGWLSDMEGFWKGE